MTIPAIEPEDNPSELGAIYAVVVVKIPGLALETTCSCVVLIAFIKWLDVIVLIVDVLFVNGFDTIEVCSASLLMPYVEGFDVTRCNISRRTTRKQNKFNNS